MAVAVSTEMIMDFTAAAGFAAVDSMAVVATEAGIANQKFA